VPCAFALYLVEACHFPREKERAGPVYRDARPCARTRRGEPAGRALLLVRLVVVGLHVAADDVLHRQVQDQGATSVAHKKTDLIGRAVLAGVNQRPAGSQARDAAVASCEIRLLCWLER
jgi:hypothetical protein